MAKKWDVSRKVEEVIAVEKDLTFQRLRGQCVTIEGWEDVQLYACSINTSENPSYVVVERKSGIMCSTVERTKKGAVESCIETLRVFGAENSKEFYDRITEIVPFQTFVVVAANSGKKEEEKDEG